MSYPAPRMTTCFQSWASTRSKNSVRAGTNVAVPSWPASGKSKMAGMYPLSRIANIDGSRTARIAGSDDVARPSRILLGGLIGPGAALVQHDAQLRPGEHGFVHRVPRASRCSRARFPGQGQNHGIEELIRLSRNCAHNFHATLKVRGHVHLPCSQTEGDRIDGVRNQQKRVWAKGSLTADRRRRLEGLPGWAWEALPQRTVHLAVGQLSVRHLDATDSNPPTARFTRGPRNTDVVACV